MLFFAVLVMSALSARAQSDGQVNDFVARLTSGVRGAGTTPSAAMSACAQLFRSVADAPAIARAAAGPAWRSMTSRHRNAYSAAIERRISADCAREGGDRAFGAITLVGASPTQSGHRLITTRVNAGGRSMTIVWRVHASTSGSSLRAVDLLVEGRSVVAALHDETAAVLAGTSGDLDAMIKAIQR
jgi:ABC-type transporter MlaC component